MEYAIMADETTSTFADLLIEMKGVLQENFPKYSVLLDELRRDTNRRNFSGSQVRVPVILNPTQMAHGLSETGTINTPKAINTTQAHINMARVAHPVSFSPDLMQASKNDITSFAEASRLRMQEAEVALGRLENEMVNGLGTGKLTNIVGTGSSTTIVVGTNTNSFQLYPGRVVDIADDAAGTLETAGGSRTIVSTVFTASTQTITLDSAVTYTSSDSVYVAGGYKQAIQGIQQVYATTGTFENISKTTTVGWSGVDGRNGDTSSADLSISILDGAERRVKVNGGNPDFYIGDPAVLDKYGQTLLSSSRWAGDKGQLETGWAGIQYRNKLLIPEFDSKPLTVAGISKNALQMYGYNQGPEWDDLDGAIFKRISFRSLPVEAWLVDYVQLGANKCNTTVFVTNLNQAA